jgi:Glycine-zipper domain
MSKKCWMFLPAMLCLSACVTLPSSPTVMVLPAAGKPFDQFQVDEILCRQYAEQQVGIAPDQAGAQNTLHGAAIGTLLGAGAGAAIGAATGSADVGAAIGAGTGLLIGTAAGAEWGAAAAGTLQWRYDVAYTQCMYAKGNQVPGVAAAPSSSVPPPPPHAPPPSAWPAPYPQAPAPR